MRRPLSPLEMSVIGRALFEASYGPSYLIRHALTRARIHHNWPHALELGSDLERYAVDLGHRTGAVAVAVGDDIYFEPTRINTRAIPVSLLGHEVTHVLQAIREGGFSRYAENYLPNYLAGNYWSDPYEVEARLVAKRISELLGAPATRGSG